jgi:hypothetical protein
MYSLHNEVIIMKSRLFNSLSNSAINLSKLSLIACVVALSGCASTISSQVTRYHDWNASNTKNLNIVANEKQNGDAEFQFFSGMLSEKLQAKQFTVSKDGKAALKVSLEYDTSLASAQVDPWLGSASFSYARRSLYMGWPYYSPFSRFDPFMDRYNVRQVYAHQIKLVISDSQTGKVLFDGRASTEAYQRDIGQFISYLMDSALYNFPGTNGKTEEVVLPYKP